VGAKGERREKKKSDKIDIDCSSSFLKDNEPRGGGEGGSKKEILYMNVTNDSATAL